MREVAGRDLRSAVEVSSPSFGFETLGLLLDFGGHCGLVVGDSASQFVIPCSEDACGEDAGVLGLVDRHGGNRNATV